MGYQYVIDKKENRKLADLLEYIKAKNWGSDYVDDP